MGLFDTVHGGRWHAQTKCLGRSLDHYRLGDEVRLEPEWSMDRFTMKRNVPVDIADFTAMALDDDGVACWLVVRDGRVHDLVRYAPAGLVRFSYHGHPLEGAEPPAAYMAAMTAFELAEEPEPVLDDALLAELMGAGSADWPPGDGPVDGPGRDLGGAAEHDAAGDLAAHADEPDDAECSLCVEALERRGDG